MTQSLFKYLRILVITLALSFTISGCGEDDSESSSVEVNNIPQEPIVINSNFSFPLPDSTPDEPNLKDVTGPWFKAGFEIVNNSENKLVIATFSMEVTVSGSDEKRQYSPDFGDFDEDRIYLTEPPVEPGETKTPEIVFYFDGLPNSDNSTYKAEATFTGFFLDPEAENDLNPIGRFEKKIRFKTQ